MDNDAVENEQAVTGAEPPPRRAPSLKRTAIAAVAGSVVLAGAVSLVPLLQHEVTAPALGPAGRARAAAGAGAPAALPDLDALIAERAAHVAKHPGDEESWAVLGAAYVERGRRTADHARYPKAEQALRRSLAVRPGEQGNVEALAGLADLARARHDYRAARQWGERAVAKAPKRWTLYPGLIEAYARLGDQKAVGKALETLQELHSGQAVLAGAAQVYRSRGWRTDAEAAVSDAVALAQARAERAAYEQLIGELAWERGEPAEALRWFDAALRTDPDRHASLAGRARAQRALGQGGAAVLTYQAALTKQPLAEYNLELGELYAAQGNAAAAQAQYDILRKRVADGKRIGGVRDDLVLGAFEAEHGDPEEAVRLLTAEWKRQPGPYASDALAWALHRAGEDERALWYAKKAVKEGPRSALFVYHLGQIERSLEEYGAARRHLQEALRINPYFSPLLVPLAKEALDALGEPPPGGPVNVYGTPPKPPAPPRAPVVRQPQKPQKQRQLRQPQRTPVKPAKPAKPVKPRSTPAR